MRLSLTFLAMLVATGVWIMPASAQSPSPYVGIQARELKAVPAERIEGLLEARGMGLALTAELNGFPGPMHVLELAEPLALTPEQAERTRTIMAAMKAEGRAIGARIVEAETHLERMFRMRHIDADRLRAQTAAIGALEADLRRVHLDAHLAMMTVLDERQIASYGRLRGYGAEGGATGAPHGQHRHDRRH